MKFALTLTAASVLAFSSFASAEQELSMTEMDNVSAGGSALGTALANAIGMTVSTSTSTISTVDATEVNFGQLGNIKTLLSTSVATSASDSDATAIAGATGGNVAMGTLLAETLANSNTDTNSTASLPFARSNHNTSGIAQTIIKGLNAESAGSSISSAVLANAPATLP